MYPSQIVHLLKKEKCVDICTILPHLINSNHVQRGDCIKNEHVTSLIDVRYTNQNYIAISSSVDLY